MKHLGIAMGIMKKNRGQKMASGGMAKLGSGKRFAHLEHSLAHQSSVKDPKALAAAIGRKKFGDKKMESMAEAHMADGGEVMCAHGGPIKCAYGCYAEGGEVGNESMPIDHDENDWLSSEGDDELMDDSQDDFLSHDEEEDPKMKRRGMLKKILEA